MALNHRMALKVPKLLLRFNRIVGPCGRNRNFHPPSGTTAVQGPIKSDEGRSIFGEYPCLQGRGLFSREARYQARYAADFDFHHAAESFMGTDWRLMRNSTRTEPSGALPIPGWTALRSLTWENAQATQ